MSIKEREVKDILQHLGVDEHSSEFVPADNALGFQGTYYTLTTKMNDHSEKYFVKSIPEGSEVVNQFYQGLGTFIKETKIYFNMFPKMQKFTVNDLWPRCYLGKEGRYLVLQDLTACGWKTPRFMDLSHIKVALEGLAELHAASMAVQEEEEDFARYTGICLEETMFSLDSERPGRQMWDAYCGVAERIVRLYLPQFEGFSVIDALQKAVSDVGPSRNHRNCLNHGDPWMNNMFFKYVDGRPSKSCFVDFQSSRFCPPALDVSIFLHIFEPLRAHELAETYHENLQKMLNRTGTTPLTKNEFNESFNLYKGPGISIASLYIFLTKLPARYLSKILASQETFIPFALGCDYSPALRGLQEDVHYRQAVLDSLQRVINFYSQT